MNEKEFVSHALHVLEHFLPTQAPLKDFIHHNTLHAFQEFPFHKGLNAAQQLFGYQTYMPLSFYREQYLSGKIAVQILDRVLAQNGQEALKTTMLNGEYNEATSPVIGALRSAWKQELGFDLDTRVHPILFRLVSSYLDQGISIWKFPLRAADFLDNLRALESNNFGSIFQTKRAKDLLLDPQIQLQDLLLILTGSEAYFESYILDQQFTHPGYSGMVNHIAEHPNILIEQRNISLTEFIFLECLLEIDALDHHFSKKWPNVSACGISPYHFEPTSIKESEMLMVKAMWQEAYEWTYYDKVLSGLQYKHAVSNIQPEAQGIFCIDDRECSIRRHIEGLHPSFASFGTPGHFHIETYFQPEGSEQRTKICPAPVQPKHLILEKSVQKQQQKDMHFAPGAYGLLLDGY